MSLSNESCSSQQCVTTACQDVPGGDKPFLPCGNFPVAPFDTRLVRKNKSLFLGHGLREGAISRVFANDNLDPNAGTNGGREARIDAVAMRLGLLPGTGGIALKAEVSEPFELLTIVFSGLRQRIRDRWDCERCQAQIRSMHERRLREIASVA